jgi:hypothetical protein
MCQVTSQNVNLYLLCVHHQMNIVCQITSQKQQDFFIVLQEIVMLCYCVAGDSYVIVLQEIVMLCYCVAGDSYVMLLCCRR